MSECLSSTKRRIPKDDRKLIKKPAEEKKKLNSSSCLPDMEYIEITMYIQLPQFHINYLTNMFPLFSNKSKCTTPNVVKVL
jgi:hypothetical protein